MNIQPLYKLTLLDDAQRALSSHHHASMKGRWSGYFDITTWLQASTYFSDDLKLELLYSDSKGEHMVEIDHCISTKNHIALLSNRILLTFSGQISSAKLRITSPSDQLSNLKVLDIMISPTAASHFNFAAC